MAHILIVYSTTYGYTAKVAAFIAGVVQEQGHCPEVIPVVQVSPALALEAYDAVIVGGSVIATRHQAALRRFVRRHRALLAQKPAAFVSVSGAAASPRPRDQADARRFARRFLAQTGWASDQVALVAGAALYRRYDRLTRWIMQLYMWRQGGDSDPSRDYEYTDWPALRAFVEGFLARLHGPRRSTTT
jgi:menaquinone-dependent protoporphyrinogen oxidase